MRITVNGQSRELAGPVTVAALLRAELASTTGCAAAVDGEVVPRSQWDSFELGEGHVVEVLTAVQGG